MSRLLKMPSPELVWASMQGVAVGADDANLKALETGVGQLGYQVVLRCVNSLLYGLPQSRQTTLPALELSRAPST